MGSNHSNSQHMVSFSGVNPTDKNNKAREAPSERERARERVQIWRQRKQGFEGKRGKVRRRKL